MRKNSENHLEDSGSESERAQMLEVQRNRLAKKYEFHEQLLRVLWALVFPIFFRFSPQPFWGWRRIILRIFGATVGARARVYPNVEIFMPWNISLGAECTIGWGVRLYALGPMKIGDRSTVSQYAHLCGGTHEISLRDRPLVKCPVTVNSDCWIAADAFIGPNVTIGRGAIIGARSVVTKNVDENTIVAGNPAQVLKGANQFKGKE